jgi:predicted PhzF superfamily epimerase YddE/YHI9
VLLSELQNPSQSITFSTKSGDLTVSLTSDEFKYISMTFPLNAPVRRVLSPSDNLIINLVVGRLPVKEVLYSKSTRKLIVRLEDSVSGIELEGMRPDFNGMVSVVQEGDSKVSGVSVTVRSREHGFHFLSRYFNPWVGINEDPVNGSSHTILAPYWASELGTSNMVARMCSPRRGTLFLESRDAEGCVVIGGHVVTVVRGDLCL